MSEIKIPLIPLKEKLYILIFYFMSINGLQFQAVLAEELVYSSIYHFISTDSPVTSTS